MKIPVAFEIRKNIILLLTYPYHLENTKDTIRTLISDENIYQTMIHNTINEDVQVLVEWIILGVDDNLQDLNLGAEFGDNFAKIIYFFDHSNTANVAPGYFMTPNSGIDLYFSEKYNLELNKKFKNYMTTIFSQYVPDQNAKDLLEKCKATRIANNGLIKWFVEFAIYKLIKSTINDKKFDSTISTLLTDEYVQEIENNVDSLDRVKYFINHIDKIKADVNIDHLNKLRLLCSPVNKSA